MISEVILLLSINSYNPISGHYFPLLLNFKLLLFSYYWHVITNVLSFRKDITMYEIEYYFDKNGYSAISDYLADLAQRSEINKALANMHDWLERNNS